MKSKMYANINNSASICHKQCDKQNYGNTNRSHVSSYALKCIDKCMNKRHESMLILFKVL